MDDIRKRSVSFRKVRNTGKLGFGCEWCGFDTGMNPCEYIEIVWVSVSANGVREEETNDFCMKCATAMVKAATAVLHGRFSRVRFGTVSPVKKHVGRCPTCTAIHDGDGKIHEPDDREGPTCEWCDRKVAWNGRGVTLGVLVWKGSDERREVCVPCWRVVSTKLPAIMGSHAARTEHIDPSNEDD